MRALCATLLDLVYPRTCAGCGGMVEAASQHLCWDCMARLEYIHEPYCSRCGDPADGMIDTVFECPFCARGKAHFDRARSAVRYRGPVRDALHAFKYSGASHLSRDFRVLLAACAHTHFREVRFDAVVPVPLFGRKERERTYNQARLLARELAGELSTPMFARGLVRVRDTSTQTDLSAPQRAANVRGAFAARAPEWLEGRRLLLVDDVMTTGATVSECARILKSAGATAVHVVTVARG